MKSGNLENISNLCHNLCMFIIECLPLVRGLNKESLSYFCPKYLEPGSLLKINIKSKKVSALVLESKEAENLKSEIKSANFQFKKISFSGAENITKPFLSKEFLAAAKETAEYFAAPVGSVLFHLIPAFFLENPNLFPISNSKVKTELIKSKREISILQSEDEERFMHYRSLIREEFAKSQSIFICLSQNEDIKKIKEKLERGIESFVFAFHNDMTKKELRETWVKASKSQHPILMIGTAKWLFFPRHDFGTIVIDKESESGWKTLSRPFIDLRLFAEKLTNQKNIKIIIGDTFLRTETLYRYRQNEIGEFENVKWRLTSNVETEIIDSRKSSKKEFKILSSELNNLIEETIEKKSHLFIFAARKGLAGSTICRDCGELVRCHNCASPMVLYKIKDSGIFKCHQCSETRDAAEVCQKCQSWKLAAFGIGIDKVAEEIVGNFPNIKIFELSKDSAESPNKAREIIKNFYESKGSILLGTELAFSFLSKKINYSAISAFDSIFSIPDFRIREKIFRIILQTREIAKEKFLIQTRNPDDQTINFALNGNLAEFYKREIDDRKILEYPPFSIFIKITIRGTKVFVGKESENLKKVLSQCNYEPTIFISSHEKKGEQAAINAVIKIPREKWPDKDLVAVLKLLPPYFEIKIDPDNLL